MNAKRLFCIANAALAAGCLFVAMHTAYAQAAVPEKIKVPAGA